MKWYPTIIILQLSMPFIGKSQSLTSRREQFNSELNYYVDSVKPNSILNGKYNVYVANFFSLSQNEFCFSLGNISNEFEFDLVGSDYIYYFHKEIVLVKMVKENNDLLKNLGLKKIDATEQKIIKEKLFPTNKGFIINDDDDLYVFCDENNEIRKRFVQDAVGNPQQSIYKDSILKILKSATIKRIH